MISVPALAGLTFTVSARVEPPQAASAMGRPVSDSKNKEKITTVRSMALRNVDSILFMVVFVPFFAEGAFIDQLSYPYERNPIIQGIHF